MTLILLGGGLAEELRRNRGIRKFHPSRPEPGGRRCAVTHNQGFNCFLPARMGLLQLLDK